MGRGGRLGCRKDGGREGGREAALSVSEVLLGRLESDIGFGVPGAMALLGWQIASDRTPQALWRGHTLHWYELCIKTNKLG